MDTAPKIDRIEPIAGRYNPIVVVDEPGRVDVDAEVAKCLYAEYQNAATHFKGWLAAKNQTGLALGAALYRLRAQSKLCQGGTTFDHNLKSLDIPRRTAYRLIAKWEVSIGARQAEPVSPCEDPLRTIGLTRGCLDGVSIHMSALADILDQLNPSKRHHLITPEHIQRLRDEGHQLQKSLGSFFRVLDTGEALQDQPDRLSSHSARVQ